MRKTVLIIVLTALVALGVNGSAGLTADISKGTAPTADPQGVVASFPSGSWMTGLDVQNLSSTTAATVIVEFYNEAGERVYTTPGAVVPPDRSTTISPGSLSGFPSGRFSAVVSSDQQIAAVANQTNYSTLGMGDSYLGMSTGATEVSLPLVFRDYSSWFSLIGVQNTSSTATANVTLRFYPTGSATYSLEKTGAIPPSSPKYFDLSASDYSALGNFVGSVIITSDQGVTAIVNLTKESGGFGGLEIFGAFTSSATKYVVPLIYKHYGPPANASDAWTSGLTVQNKAATPTDVRMTFKPTNAAGQHVKEATIPGNSSFSFYLPNYPDIPSGLYGSAIVESLTGGNQIQVLASTTRYSSGMVMGYNAFPDTAGSTKIVVPQAFKGWSSGWTSGIEVFNMGSADTTVRVKYIGTSTAGSWERDIAIPSQRSSTFYFGDPANSSFPSASYGSVVIQSIGASPQPIVAVVNHVNYAQKAGMTYTGINQ